jgi:PAS domain S-box-containing protein
MKDDPTTIPPRKSAAHEERGTGGDDSGPTPRRTLRRRAEDRIREEASPDGLPLPPGSLEEADRARFLHEIQVHQVELEVQNEELRRTYRELEISRARYMDLFDFAPIAYLTLGEGERIVEANLTASILLGVPRADLVNRPFTRFIHGETETETFRQGRRTFFDTGESWHIELRLLRENVPFWASLRAVAARDHDGSSLCRLVVMDISDRKRDSQERELLISELRAALEHVKQLSGLLPICAWCKKVRDDQGYWNAIESYISDHSEAQFTHSVCPDCRDRHFGHRLPRESKGNKDCP